ncbi:MAG: NAD-dependent epimerase/dehydratase family protein [Planctomycetes bacterium]|nr:NAD-dependent epimerase/dehydratase family protein [Planctomycetota bacterium]
MGNPRVLITGAGGFIGSHTARHFGSLGYPICAVGRFAAKSPGEVAYPNLELLAAMTLPDPAFERAVDWFRPDVVIHAAGTASVPFSIEQPYRDFQKTVEVCAFVLETLRVRAPRCRFILLSSASVYGNPESLPIAETAPCRPISPYASHKRMCELLVEEYASIFGMKTVTARLFSVYGDPLRRQVIYDICGKINDSGIQVDYSATIGRDSKSGKIVDSKINQIVTHGTGNESRDFMHVKDVAGALERIVQADFAGLINVSSGQETTIRQLCELLSGLLGCARPVEFTGLVRTGDPVNWRADISKLLNLGYKPEISIEEGLKQYCDWFKQSVMTQMK